MLPASLALALSFPIGAMADTTADVRALQKEMKAMRADYEARLKALEQRVKAVEAAAKPTDGLPGRLPRPALGASHCRFRRVGRQPWQPQERSDASTATTTAAPTFATRATGSGRGCRS